MEEVIQPEIEAVTAPPSGVAGKPVEHRRAWQTWVRDGIISLLVAAFINIFIYQSVRVEGTSMQPELADHDRLFINKVTYHIRPIQRGDVVVFNYPRDPSKSYIKRIVGLPGETLVIDRGRVYINGQLLPEPYVAAHYRDQRSTDVVHIPPGEYYVLGDHRNISADSREFGPVERSLICGRADFIYWPMRELGRVE